MDRVQTQNLASLDAANLAVSIAKLHDQGAPRETIIAVAQRALAAAEQRGRDAERERLGQPARELLDWTERWGQQHIISQQMREAMERLSMALRAESRKIS